MTSRIRIGVIGAHGYGRRHVERVVRGGEAFRTVRGVEEWAERAAWEGRTFAQLEVR